MTNGTGGGWAAVVVWIAIQLTLTSLPGASIPVSINHPLDWLGHCAMYGVLGALVARVAMLRGWPRRRVFRRRRSSSWGRRSTSCTSSSSRAGTPSSSTGSATRWVPSPA